MNSYLENLSGILPDDLRDYLKKLRTVYEIRIRVGRKAIIVSSEGKLSYGTIFTEEQFNRIFVQLNGGSYYKHEQTLPYGYFTDIFGGRCGAACDIVGDPADHPVIRVRGLNIRVPRSIRGVSDELCRYFLSRGKRRGMLIFAPPCTGKTTVIRDLAGKLAEPPNGLCVCVADERREFIWEDYSQDANLDILSGYRKKNAMEIAIRSLSADVIICDEIGDFEDAEGVCQLASSGVPLIATVHAEDIEDLKNKTSIVLMNEKKLFGTIVRLSGFQNDTARFEYHEIY